MSTFTDGPSLSVTPGPDEDAGPDQLAVPAPTTAPSSGPGPRPTPGPVQSSTPRRRAAADRDSGQEPDWLQLEIQRRIAAKSGSGGRHARRGSQPPPNFLGYERRHNPSGSTPPSGSPALGGPTPDVPTPDVPAPEGPGVGAPAAIVAGASNAQPTGPTPMPTPAPRAPERAESPSWPATPVGPGLPSIERTFIERVRTLPSPASGRTIGAPRRPVTPPSKSAARLLSPPVSPPSTPTGIPIDQQVPIDRVPDSRPARPSLSDTDERALDEAYDAGFDEAYDDVADDERGTSTGPLPLLPRIGPPPTASPEIEAAGEVIWTAVTPARTPPARSPLAVPAQRGAGSDGVSATAPQLVAVRPPPSIPVPTVTETPDDEQPVVAEGEAPIKRVRVVMAERKQIARPVRTVVDVQEGTGVGQMLRSNLIGSQLTVALTFAAGAVLTLGLLPLLFAYFPDVSTYTVLGIRLPWLLLGFLVYPFLLGLGWWHTRTAERVEQNFADHVQD